MYRETEGRQPSESLRRRAGAGRAERVRTVDETADSPHLHATFLRSVLLRGGLLVAAGTLPVVASSVVAQRNPDLQSAILCVNLVLVFALLGGVMWLRARVPAWLIERERRSLGHCGFVVKGYFDNLGRAPVEGRVVVEIEAASRLPERDILAGLAAGVRAELTEFSPHRARIVGPLLAVVASDESSFSPNNVELLRWQRAVLAKVLLPIHTELPLDAVVFSRAHQALR